MKIELNVDRKTLAIGILSLSAIGLVIANFAAPPKAQAAYTVHGDQYTAITARVANGGEALYLTNRDGLMVAFVYDPNQKRLDPRAFKPVLDAFNAGGAAAGPIRPNRPGGIRP